MRTTPQYMFPSTHSSVLQQRMNKNNNNNRSSNDNDRNYDKHSPISTTYTVCRCGTSTHYSNILYTPSVIPTPTHGECLFATNMQSYSPFAKMTTIHPFLQNFHSLLLPVPIILLLPLLFVLVNAQPMDSVPYL